MTGLAPQGDPTPLLSVEGVSIRFGGIVALDGVSFQVSRGRICGLIGPNGAGKTTLFNCISRLYRPAGGDIRFEGRPLHELARHEIATRGIGRTFQNLALFRSMTVTQNVLTGTHRHGRGGFVAHALGFPVVRREECEARDRAAALVGEFGLASVADLRVGELPFGTQKRVELTRALASEPKLLLLDEPAAGLNHAEVEELRSDLEAIRSRRGITMLLVEHHMNLVMGVADQVVVLDFGRKIADGAPGEVQRHADVLRAYLGTAG
ncbi:MAG: ABC transporter ATP-binding protein [Methylobacteriaceae bacterium]|nr:ABC transporter ATP-binding protein [Methylobacteriaceae bacterium]